MKRKFTLIEILGVTILISILAAIGIAAYSYAMESSKESATRALITRVSTAFEALREEGLLPRTQGSSGTEFLMLVFNPDPTTVNYSGTDKDEKGLRFTDGTSSTELGSSNTDKAKAYKLFAKAIGADSIKRNLNEKNQLTDSWGNPIYVRYPGKFNRGGFDIIAAGSDGGFSEDIDSTPSDDIDDYRDSDNEWLCDDITNF